MEYKQEVNLGRQADYGLLALVYAMSGEEGKADHVRAIARAKYEAEERRDTKEAAIA